MHILKQFGRKSLVLRTPVRLCPPIPARPLPFLVSGAPEGNYIFFVSYRDYMRLHYKSVQ